MFTELTEREKLIYLAGLMDGEGCFKLSTHGGGLRPIIQLNMTDKEVVSIFANHFGITMRTIKAPSHLKDIAEKGHKQQYVARTECQKAYPIIKALYPFLITKKQDALVCLNYYDDRQCQICKGQIPPEKNKSSVVCSDTCYRQYKLNFDRDRRVRLKEEKQMAIEKAKQQLTCQEVSKQQ